MKIRKIHTRLLAKRLVSCIALIVTIVVSYWILLGIDSYFTIRKIIVEGGENLRGVEEINKNILLLNSKIEEERILLTNPSLMSVDINKVFPQTLIITVASSKPIAYLVEDEKAILLNKDGKILGINTYEETESYKETLITYYHSFFISELRTGSILPSDEIRCALFMVENFKERGIALEKVAIEGVDMVLLQSHIGEIVVSSRKEFDLQLEMIEKVVKDIRIRGEKFRKLDVRFSKPVIM